MSATASPPPAAGARRRAGIAAALGLLTVAGLWASRPDAHAQPPVVVVDPVQGERVEVLVEEEAMEIAAEEAIEIAEAATPGPPIKLGGAPADDRGPAALLPADGAAVYVAFAGADVAGPALKETAAYAALVDSGLFPAVGSVFEAVLENGTDDLMRAVEDAAGDAMRGGGFDRDIEVEVIEEEMLEEEMLEEERLDGAAEPFDDELGEPDAAADLRVIEEDLDAFDEEFEADGGLGGGPRPEALVALQGLGQAVWAGGGAVSVHVLPGGPPLPSAFVVLPGAADAAEALLSASTPEERDLLRLREVTVNGVTVLAGNIPEAPPMYNFALWRVGDHLVAAVGPGAVEAATAVTAGDADGLDAAPLLEQTPDDALLAGWLDVATIADTFGGFAVTQADWRESGQVTVADVFAATGLDALAGYRGSLSADGPALRSESEWTLRGEARGLLAALDPAPMSTGDLPPMPAAAGFFAATSVDWAVIYDGLLDAAAETAELLPPGSEPRMILENPAPLLNDFAGFDVRADLLEPLGHVNVAYGDPTDGGLLGLGGVVAVSVDDGDRVDETLGALLMRTLDRLPPEDLEELLEAVSIGGTVARGSVEDGTDVTVTTVSVGGFFRPSWAVTDDWLILAPNPIAVKAFLLREDGTLPRWEPAGAWAEPFGRVPAEFTTLTAADPRPTAALVHSVIASVLPAVAQFATGEGASAHNVDLPPTELVTGPLFPNVGWAVNTGAGVEGVTYASLPAVVGGAGGGGGGVASSAILVSLVLPAVQQARAAARRSQSMNNLKQQALAAHNHHSVYNTFPRGTMENDALPVQKRLSFHAKLLPFMDQTALWNRLDKDAAWNAGANRRIARTQVPSLLNPSDPGGPTTDDGYAATHYVGIAGVGANAAKSLLQTGKTGIFGYDRATPLRDVRDGATNTLMYGTVSGDVGPWAQGGNATVRPFTTKPYINGPDGFGGYEAGGTNFAFADGAVKFLSEDIDPQVLEAMATANGGEVIDEPDF